MLPANPLLNATAPAGPHLPVALLRQYAAGALAPAAQHRVEAHTLACSRCADILSGLMQTTPATTDQALAQLQLRLRRRMQQQTPARPVLGQRQHRWLAPQLAAAAALLLGLVAGGWWVWQQQHAAATASRPVVTMPVAASAPPVAPAVPAATKAVPMPARPATIATAPATSATAPHPFPTAPSYLKNSKLSHQPVASSQPAATPADTTALAQAKAREADALPIIAATPAHLAPDSARPQAAAPDSREAAKRVVVKAAAVPAGAAAWVRADAMPSAPPLAPAPMGGYAALRERLRREATEFVPEAPERPMSGTVQLRLTISPDGKIEKITVLRGLRDDYDAEAQRLVREGPAWRPGISSGRRAAQVVDVAVPF